MGVLSFNKTFLNHFNTPKACSCFMCGNPRKYWNEKSREEIISKTSFTNEKRYLLQEHNEY